MQLSEEEKQKQNAITDAIKNQQPVEDLAETCNSEDEAKISKSITMELIEVIKLMGVRCPPPEKNPRSKNFSGSSSEKERERSFSSARPILPHRIL